MVVNRILRSAMSEVWRFHESNELSIKAIDDAVSASRIAPMGPFFLTELLGLDTVLHVAEHLHHCYGDSFYVHEGMRPLLAARELGAKTGKGFYDGSIKDAEAVKGRRDRFVSNCLGSAFSKPEALKR